VTFGGADTPGIEIIMPDIEFIMSIKKDLLGIVLTHAHEDHMGALGRLWPQLECPVYATPFTMYLVKDRLSEFGLLDLVPLHEVELKGKFSLGPFDFELITMTHSIAEPNALAIRTELGTILHTGDWKIDEAPQIGEPVDAKALRALGDEGILAMVCDSTNVFSPGYAGSEDGVRDELIKLVGEYAGKGVAVASFASNVARLESVMMAAKANDRSVCLVGRSMKRMTAAAKSIGLLKDVGHMIDEDDARSMPAAHVLYLCTGSQGEPRAALSRIAAGEHRNVKFHKGDVVIFSSKIIPGNEKGIFALCMNGRGRISLFPFMAKDGIFWNTPNLPALLARNMLLPRAMAKCLVFQRAASKWLILCHQAACIRTETPLLATAMKVCAYARKWLMQAMSVSVSSSTIKVTSSAGLNHASQDLRKAMMGAFSKPLSTALQMNVRTFMKLCRRAPEKMKTWSKNGSCPRLSAMSKSRPVNAVTLKLSRIR